MMFFKGIGALLLTLAAFSLFSLKFPRGDKAMGGLADAAVAHLYVYQGAVIGGDVSSVEAGGFCYPLTARADQGKDSGKDGTAG